MKRFLFVVFLFSLCSFCFAGPVKQYKVKVLAQYPHDVNSYTQGLFFYNGVLHESAGQYGKSSFRVVNLATGKSTRKLDFGKYYFLEGSVELGGLIYMLTWQEKRLFVYDASTLEFKKSYFYPREGWGLTTDGKSLIASDGSDKLYFLSPDLKLEKSISVRNNGRPQRLLNELEWIDGKIWANVYTTDIIVIIDPSTGEVVASVNCQGLLKASLRRPETDVLNGIAYLNDSTGSHIYLTGKNWPLLFEVELVE